MKVVLRITFDSAPPKRSALLYELARNNGKLSTSEIEDIIGDSKPTTIRLMQEMVALGICKYNDSDGGKVGRPDLYIVLADEFDWITGPEIKNMLDLYHKENE
jgi:predicted transcriptional regulator